MARKLKNLLIDRVDLVDKGANPEAHIVLFKRDAGDNNGMSVATNQEPAAKDRERSLLKSAWELVAKHLGIQESKTEGEENMEDRTVDIDTLLKGVSGEVKDAIKAAFEKQEKRLEELEKRLAELMKSDVISTEDDINKADLPEPVRKRLEELERKAQLAEEIAKQEREARVKAEIKKRAENYANVGEINKIAEAIFKAHSVSPEFAEELEELLKTANERIAKGDLFKEFGSNGTPISSDPASQFAEMVEKMAQEENLSYAEAARKVAKQHPDLVDAYDSAIPVGEK